jgi:23S rRNA A2030 N6-methylase RlmJ
MTQPEIANKLSELLEVIKKSVQTNEQNKETLLDAHQLGIQDRTDLLKLHEEQEAQLATLMTQNTLSTGPALHPTPLLWKTH